MRIVVLLVLFTGFGPSLGRAQSGGAYSLDWNNVAGGGAMFSTAGAYRLGGSIGQPDAGELLGGNYSLQGGFWTPVVSTPLDAPRDATIPAGFVALSPAPNPSRDIVRLTFDLPDARTVRLTVHDLSGGRVRSLLEGRREAGRHTVLWDGTAASGRRAPPGIYFVRVEAGDQTATQRFVRLD